LFGPVAGSYEHDNECSISTKGWEFLDQLRNSKLLKKKPAAWSYEDTFY